MFEFQSKHYEPGTDDLFLVYTAIDESFNKNGWRVEDIDKNIKSGLGRPGIIKPKDPNNPIEHDQSGQFIHPVFPGASLQTLLQNQEVYSIARAVRLDKPSPTAPWRVWLHVTDPNAKLALKNASTGSNSESERQYPRYISPQVITFPSDFPNEENAKTYKHWIISHWAFVDVPAYGEQMKVRGNCYGAIDDCKIKLQNASTANFCVKQAIAALNSSHNTNSQTQSIMAESSNAQSNSNNSNAQPVQSDSQQVGQLTYSWQPVQTTAATNTTLPYSNQPISNYSKQEPEPGTSTKPGQEKNDTNQVKPVNKEEDKEAPIGETTEDLKKVIADLRRQNQEQEKRTKLLEEDNVIRKQNEKRYQMAAKIAKYSYRFKSKDAFDKEIDTAVRYSQVMSEEELEEYLDRKLGVAAGEEIAIKARSASAIVSSSTTTTNQQHEVLNVQAQVNNASSNSSDISRKCIELIDMFSNGGTS